MIPKRISEIVYSAAAAPSKAEKIAIIRQNDSPALRGYLRIACDPNIKLLLPEGIPPIKQKPEAGIDTEYVLYNEYRRMYIFLEGGNPNLTPSRREMIWVQLLEMLSPEDVKFMCEVVKDKKLPEGLTVEILSEAFGTNV